LREGAVAPTIDHVVWLVALTVLTLAGACYQAVASARARRRFPPPGCFIGVDGHRLHATCVGVGETTVLLESGVAASSLSWTRVQPALAAFSRACAYDRAGLAWSDAPVRPRTVERILDELNAVGGGVAGDGRAVLVGHSFGALIVRAYAARRPDRVVGLVLVDPPVEWFTITPERRRLLRGARYLSLVGVVLAHLGVVRAALALLTGGAPGASRAFVKAFGPTAARTLERLVGEVRKLPPEVHPVVEALWCQPKCFRAMASYLNVLETEGAGLGAVRPPPDVPVIVISGGHQPRDLVDAQRRFGGAALRRQIIAHGSGHWVPFDEPGLVVDSVRELVESAAGDQPGLPRRDRTRAI
jgi:pimeloyl-ACP methyl ester carboxylesterase